MHWDLVATSAKHWNTAEFLVEEVNDILRYNKVSDVCATLSLDREKKITVKQSKDAGEVFNIKFHTEPNNGTMVGNVRLLEDGSFYRLSRTIERLDNYHDQSHCTSNIEARELCYCKDNANIK